MKFIIPILVGATIGYITNWLAIKMLFRPHYEKRLLGFHIPFTPGLIPKERYRIAKSVGETVGEYLLSPEVIRGSLLNNNIIEYIGLWVESNINRFKQEDRSIKTIIENLNYGDYTIVLNKIEKKIVDSIYNYFKQDNFKYKIVDIVEYHVFQESRDDIYKIINEKIGLFLCKLSTSKEIKLKLNNIIENKIKELSYDQRTLGQLISDDIIYTIKNLINEHDREIGNLLRNMLEDPLVEFKLRESIVGLVSQNMGKVLLMFMSPETISDKVLSMIKEYLNKPEVNHNIVSIIITLIDKLLERKVGDIVINFSSKLKGEEIERISESMIRYISNEENQKKVLSIIDEKIKLEESNFREGAMSFVEESLDALLNSENFYEKIYITVQEIIENLFHKPISSIAYKIDETIIENIISVCNHIFDDFVNNKLPYMVELFNISKVVEDQINSFDVAFAEEIIVEIANKELKAITWLGALLGGFMGILSPVLQML